MIDLALPIFFVSWLFLKLFPLHGKTIRYLLAAAALAFALSLFCFYRTPAKFDYVIHPSAASAAGLKGRGEATTVGGEPVAGLGSFFAAALWQEQTSIRAGRDFARECLGPGWRFWQALDSYVLEECSGGLALLPRRPIYHGAGGVLLPAQITALRAGEWLRFIQAGEKPLTRISEMLTELTPLPPGGVIPIRVMRPSPDTAVQTVVFSPVALQQRRVKGLPMEQAAQLYFDFSGLPVTIVRYSQPDVMSTLYEVSGVPVYGPGLLKREARNPRERWRPRLEFNNFSLPFGNGTDYLLRLVLRPRVSLLPWMHKHAFVSWMLSVPGTAIRQVASLMELPRLFSLKLPMQAYLLDDAFTWSFFWFRLGSLSVSLALAGVLRTAVSSSKGAGRIRDLLPLRSRGILLLLLVVALQLGDLFVIHQILV